MTPAPLLCLGARRASAVDADFQRVWHAACLLTELTALAGAAAAPSPTPEERTAVIRALLKELS